MLCTTSVVHQRKDFKMTNTNIADISKFIASRIDKLRVDNGFSIRELAKKSFISHNSLFSIIQGNKSPNIFTLSNICKALNISLSDFFNLEDTVIALRGKEAILIKIFREISPMSQDTLIKVSKCMK